MTFTTSICGFGTSLIESWGDSVVYIMYKIVNLIIA